jgi:hypothetical protein
VSTFLTFTLGSVAALVLGTAVAGCTPTDCGKSYAGDALLGCKGFSEAAPGVGVAGTDPDASFADGGPPDDASPDGGPAEVDAGNEGDGGSP